MMLQAVVNNAGGSSSPAPAAAQQQADANSRADDVAQQQLPPASSAPTPNASQLQQPQVQDELRSAALRMRSEMPLKERIIHLQTFKYTFTGQQAVAFLQQQGLAANADVATDMCQRMLSQGLFKSVHHGEVYRFSSSFPDGQKDKQKGSRMPGSITSTGLYKEIAKIGKTAAQPFKNIQLSLNDTFNSLGSLSIPTTAAGATSAHSSKPLLPGVGALGGLGSSGGGGGFGRLGGAGLGGSSSRPRSSGSGATRSMLRRSQTGKLLQHHHHAFSEGAQFGHQPDGGISSLAALVGSMEALQAAVKESTSLLRLDLQQHTALQEHLVGILVAQQDQTRFTQLLIAINAAAVLLLLLFSSGTWPAALAAGGLLLLLLYGFVGPDVLSHLSGSRQAQLSSTGGGSVLLRRSSVLGAAGAAGAAAGAGVRGGLEPPLARLSRRGSSKQLASRATAEGHGGVSLGGADTNDRHQDVERTESDEMSESNDEVEELVEDSIPYSEDFDDWPDAPVMLCPDPAATHQQTPGTTISSSSSSPCHALRVNGPLPIPFESELFKGVLAVYIRHLPTTPSTLFKGKKRLAWVAIQGTFKQPVLMDHLVYGMQFSRQLSNLPAPWFLENMLLPLARKISPSLRVGTLEDPYFFSPIITASQVVNVSLPGEAPPLMEAKEDTRLLLEGLSEGKAGDGLTVSARRRFFQAAANRQQTHFSTQHVWTFHLWQEYIDYSSYMLNLGYSSYDLTQHLDGQPLQLMAKDESTGQQLFSMHVWHANLVRSLTRRMPRRHRMSRVSNVSQEDGLQDRSVQVSQGGFGPDATTAAAVSSPTAAAGVQQQTQQTPEPQQTPEQQQQQTHSSPLPSISITPVQLEQQMLSDSDQQQQQLDLTPQHQQQQRGGSSTSQQQQHFLQFSSLSDSRLQRPSGLQEYRDSSASGGSMSDTEGAAAAGSHRAQPSAAAHPQQLSPLRPSGRAAAAAAAAAAGPLQQQLSLPAQQLAGSQRDLQLPRAELQSISTSGGSSGGTAGGGGAAAAASWSGCGAGGSSSTANSTPSRTPVAAAAAHADSSWGASVAARAAAVVAGSSGSRSARASWTGTAAAGGGEESGFFSDGGGAESPLACRTPRHPSVGGAGAVVVAGAPPAAAAAGGALRQLSSRKKREPRDSSSSSKDGMG